MSDCSHEHLKEKKMNNGKRKRKKHAKQEG